MDSHDATKAQVPQVSTDSSSLSYWWFQGDSVKALMARLMASNLDTAVLKCRPTSDGKLMLSVHEDGAAARAWVIADNDEINASHVCPIDCP